MDLPLEILYEIYKRCNDNTKYNMYKSSKLIQNLLLKNDIIELNKIKKNYLSKKIFQHLDNQYKKVGYNYNYIKRNFIRENKFKLYELGILERFCKKNEYKQYEERILHVKKNGIPKIFSK